MFDQHTRILNWHVPTAKVGSFGTQGDVAAVERGLS